MTTHRLYFYSKHNKQELYVLDCLCETVTLESKIYLKLCWILRLKYQRCLIFNRCLN